MAREKRIPKEGRVAEPKQLEKQRRKPKKKNELKIEVDEKVLGKKKIVTLANDDPKINSHGERRPF